MGFEFISNYVFIVELTLCIYKEKKILPNVILYVMKQ